ncbi:MAG TPA: M28 family metallopeptidase [Gemmatimonadales bacterium]|nr:M28 family metallopeptidase [Gemmatimonadales bacterium]
MIRLPSLLPVLLLAAGCAGGENAPANAAAAAIDSAGLLEHTRVLSSDEFEGRAPGTPGEEKTVQYLTEQFRGLGLQPGNPDGSYQQVVDMIGFTATASAELSVGSRTIPLASGADIVISSRRNVERVEVPSSDLVFVGYGVDAPEYGWDDYKGLDVRGKTLVMLVNDPPVPDPADSTRLDTTMFRGKAMTYYGRWTYKYEIATEKGAAAALLVHQTGPAGYPWEVVQGSWGLENIDIKRADRNMNRVAVEGWITEARARELFQAAGMDFDALQQAARSRDFQPVALNARARFTVANSLRDLTSRNVIARLEGSDPALRDEYVVYTAHWDHLGRDTTAAGDQIFNGALDNASGTAALLELAEAFTRLPEPPKRSILFLAVTAEEKGLAGAKYYAEQPLYPLEKTLANINIDGVNQWGRTSDVTVIGLGNSTLDDVLREVAEPLGRTLAPDPESEKGFFYRSDHFEFAKKGVPALYTDSGIEFIGKPAGYGQSKRDEYTANDYHKPSDEIKPDWDLSGAVEDTRLLFLVGMAVANGSTWPEWKPGTEFKATREAMLKGN